MCVLVTDDDELHFVTSWKPNLSAWRWIFYSISLEWFLEALVLSLKLKLSLNFKVLVWVSRVTWPQQRVGKSPWPQLNAGAPCLLLGLNLKFIAVKVRPLEEAWCHLVQSESCHRDRDHPRSTFQTVRTCFNKFGQNFSRFCWALPRICTQTSLELVGWCVGIVPQ